MFLRIFSLVAYLPPIYILCARGKIGYYVEKKNQPYIKKRQYPKRLILKRETPKATIRI